MERSLQARIKLDNLRYRQSEIGKEFDSIDVEVQNLSECATTTRSGIRNLHRYAHFRTSPVGRTLNATHLAKMEEEMFQHMQKVRELREECKCSHNTSLSFSGEDVSEISIDSNQIVRSTLLSSIWRG